MVTTSNLFAPYFRGLPLRQLSLYFAKPFKKLIGLSRSLRRGWDSRKTTRRASCRLNLNNPATAVHTPEGVSSIRSGLLYSATQGNERDAPPNHGVAAPSGQTGGSRSVASPSHPRGAATTPLGLSRPFPRVAEYSNPGLIDETLSGFKMPKLQCAATRRTIETPSPARARLSAARALMYDEAVRTSSAVRLRLLDTAESQFLQVGGRLQ